MDTAFSLGVAVDIAVRAHGDQVRTLAGDRVEPYLSHPLRVMAAVHDERARAVAVLHDVLEDTEWEASDLRAAGVPAMVVEAVLALTRHDGESYESFIERILTFGEPAVSVKRADITDNIARLHGPWESRRAHYLQALGRLEDG